VPILLSKKYFHEETFLATLDEIFKNYEMYATNAKNLAKKLPAPLEDKNTANRLVEILTEIQGKE